MYSYLHTYIRSIHFIHCFSSVSYPSFKVFRQPFIDKKNILSLLCVELCLLILFLLFHAIFNWHFDYFSFELFCIHIPSEKKSILDHSNSNNVARKKNRTVCHVNFTVHKAFIEWNETQQTFDMVQAPYFKKWFNFQLYAYIFETSMKQQNETKKVPTIACHAIVFEFI